MIERTRYMAPKSARVARLSCFLGFGFAAALSASCGSDDSKPSPAQGVDAGPGVSGQDPTSDPGKGFWITVSGEDLAVSGYDWTQGALADGDPPAFVDGWALSFEHVLVTIGHVRVSRDPDQDPANPKNVGAVVASAEGPFAVDLTVGGSVPGKSGSPDEKTVPIAAFPTMADGSEFDATARYAFGYDLVPASAAAKLVNLDEAGRALYQRAQAEGFSSVYVGTATYKGPAPEPGSVFAKLSQKVHFTLGFKNPSSFDNCQNTDLMQVGGEFPRGIQPIPHMSTIAQITLHTDHAFWNQLNVEGAPLAFDAIAAQARGAGDAGTIAEVSTDDLLDADITGFKTRAGEILPARSLVSDYAAPQGQLRYAANGTRFSRANSLASYLSYAAASGGHLNADGECVVTNHFVP